MKTKTSNKLTFSVNKFVATSALALVPFLLALQPVMAQDGDLAEEQMQEKQALGDMRQEMQDINSTLTDALGELNQLGKKVANQSNAKEFHLFARESDWETYSGSSVKCLTYNGKIPGPPILVTEGDFVRIVLHNNMKTSTSLQFHGMTVPHSVGGIPRSGAGLVTPEQAFVYQFVAKQPGTFWYHPQVIHPTQKQLGLYGAIIVQPKLRSRPYDKDVTLIFSELRKTPGAVADTAGSAASKKVTALKVSRGADGKPRAATVPILEPPNEQPKSNFTATAWTEGASPPDVDTDYLINGKAAPSIPTIELRKGQRVRLRLINAGQEAIPLQLSGHRLEIVSLNGGDRLEPHVFRDTLSLNPCDRADVEFTADNPGVWSLSSESAHQSTRNGKFPGGMACVVRYSELKAQPNRQPAE